MTPQIFPSQMALPSPLPNVEAVAEAISRVADPEFGLSIVDLGLIYDIRVEDGEACVTMTLTSFYCPAGQVILDGVHSAAETVPGITSARVDLVWEPTWTPDRLSEAGRKQLGWDSPIIPE